MRAKIGTKDEHWGLHFKTSLPPEDEFHSFLLDGTYNPITDFRNEPLLGHITNKWKDSMPGQQYTPLGSTEPWDYSPFECQIYILFESIHLGKKSTEVGGNCMDFIAALLEELKRRKMIKPSVKKVYDKIMAENYEKVRQTTWPSDVSSAPGLKKPIASH